MNKLLCLLTLILFNGIAQAQLLKITSGSDLTILSGTPFRVENLTLIPSSDFTISNNSLDKFSTVINNTANPYIARVYQFTNSTKSYSGSVQINYISGVELNSIPENMLTLNIHNGTAWNAFSATTHDATNHFVLTNAVTSASLNEITLANASKPLPLVWISFSAVKQNRTALLKWESILEVNTKQFLIQHSKDGENWINVGLLPATGRSDAINTYNFTHMNPVSGINYYRILQNDNDSRFTYSNTITLQFANYDEPFTLMGNIITNHLVTMQVNKAGNFVLYSNDGKLLWQKNISTGLSYIPLDRYAKGIYILKTSNMTQKVIIR